MKLGWPQQRCVHKLPPPVMPRRSSPRKPRRPAAANARPANLCRALVPVNGAAIRKKIQQHYAKARRDLDAARRQLDQFNQTDQPKFSQWINHHCGALLTELRELGQKLAADEQLVMEVGDEVMFGAGSYARAFQRVMHRRANPEPPPPAPAAEERGRAQADGGSRPEFSEAGEADPLAEFFKALFGEFAPGEEWPGARGPEFGAHRKSAPPAHASARLKELYRAVVRRLHPDRQGEMTPQKTEWWHQAQAAYEAGDADQLELILTLCEIADGGSTAQTSASLLQRITAQLKSSLREIKRQLTVGRRDPAWNFSQRSDHAALLTQLQRKLKAEVAHLRQAWEQTQATIAGWQAAADRLKPLGRRKPQPTEQEFLF